MKFIKRYEADINVKGHSIYEGALMIELSIQPIDDKEFTLYLNMIDATDLEYYMGEYICVDGEYEEVDITEYDIIYNLFGNEIKFREQIKPYIIEYLKSNNIPPMYIDTYTNTMIYNIINNVNDGNLNTPIINYDDNKYFCTSCIITDNKLIVNNIIINKEYDIDVNNIDTIGDALVNYMEIFNKSIDGKYIWDEIN